MVGKSALMGGDRTEFPRYVGKDNIVVIGEEFEADLDLDFEIEFEGGTSREGCLLDEQTFDAK